MINILDSIKDLLRSLPEILSETQTWKQVVVVLALTFLILIFILAVLIPNSPLGVKILEKMVEKSEDKAVVLRGLLDNLDSDDLKKLNSDETKKLKKIFNQHHYYKIQDIRNFPLGEREKIEEILKPQGYFHIRSKDLVSQLETIANNIPTKERISQYEQIPSIRALRELDKKNRAPLDVLNHEKRATVPHPKDQPHRFTVHVARHFPIANKIIKITNQASDNSDDIYLVVKAVGNLSSGYDVIHINDEQNKYLREKAGNSLSARVEVLEDQVHLVDHSCFNPTDYKGEKRPISKVELDKKLCKYSEKITVKELEEAIDGFK